MATNEISVLAEIERIGIKYDWASENEVKVRCPFHADESPSCHVNTEKRVFKCQTAGCGKSGDFIGLLARFLLTTRAVVYEDLSQRYTFDTAKIIDPQLIERYHAAIWSAKPLLAELYKRGITDDDIREYRLGEDKGRVQIPVKNEGDLFVNIRKYLPGAPGADKMRNVKGHGKSRLYPYDQLRFDTIVICGGELKAIAAARQLNRFGIGAVCATAGEGNWDVVHTKQFVGKRVYICMDIDDEGQKAASDLCQLMTRIAIWVGNLVLPLDKDKYPKGDINDFIGQEGGRLKPLLKDVPEWVPVTKSLLQDGPAEELELQQATNAKAAGKRIKVRAVVAAMDTAPYVIPKDLTVLCDKSQQECALCPAYILDKDKPFMTLHPESAAILEMINARKNTQREALMGGLGIPKGCKIVDFEVTEYYNVEDTRISPQLEITNRTADRVMQPAVCVGTGAELNESYVFTGRMHPHPATQQSTLLISAYEPTKDALSTYQCHDLDKLLIFQPTEWTVDSIAERLERVYSDLEANVTRIYQRRDIHSIFDLTIHSPLFLNFDGRVVKGWVESLIVGDSAQGKSETCMNLMQHYGLGEKVECKNASVAGLLGGLQKMGDRWFVTWGVIPTHDKRFVLLEELKGTSTEVISKLTDMRSSGIAEIPKIEKRKTHARTRLCALSNSRSGHAMSTYNFGIEAIVELIGSLEDVRRFDVALVLNANEVDSDRLNQLQRSRPSVEHIHTSDLCRSLILWGWTRTAAQVMFDVEATDRTLEVATELSNEFSDAIPVLDRGSARYKVARLAAALAVRTFSHGENHEILVVRKCHVEYTAAFLRRVYSSHVFGYADFTSAINITQTLLDPDSIKKAITMTPFPGDFMKALLHTNKIDLQDIMDWCGWDRIEATQLLSLLVRKHALRRDGRSYRKTPKFITLIKEVLEKKDFAERPDFMKDINTEF